MANIYVFSAIILLSHCALFAYSQTNRKLEVNKYYHIESHDGALLSVGGGTSSDVKIVTEVPQGTSPRQRFLVGSGATHEIRPEMQNVFRNLVLEINLESSLLFQQTRNFRRHQWWKILSLNDEKNEWRIENDRTGQCLSTRGVDTQVFGTVCDLNSVNQTWIFHLQ